MKDNSLAYLFKNRNLKWTQSQALSEETAGVLGLDCSEHNFHLGHRNYEWTRTHGWIVAKEGGNCTAAARNQSGSPRYFGVPPS
jgi:hypothetical protein